MYKHITIPLTLECIESLKAGDMVSITGVIYTARDMAHKRLIDQIEKEQELPIQIKDRIIYYVGPCPAREGYIIGSAGPTTSGRMDKYTLQLLKLGMKGMIGKGARSPEVINAIKKYKAIYFGAIGGAGALISKCIKKQDIIAYADLGTEAIRRLEVENFPVIVLVDSCGNDLYTIGRKQYQLK